MLSVVREQNERLTAFADIITHNLRSHSGNLSTIKGFLEDEFSWLKENESFMLLKVDSLLNLNIDSPYLLSFYEML